MLLFAGSLHAQSAQPAMADAMRSDGKIYVVVAVMLIIFLLLACYLVIIDRKITKIEKEIKAQIK